MPHYLGTLAAVRCLGALGVPITVAGRGLLGPARWSRYTNDFVAWPHPHHAKEFVAALLHFGDEHPGHFLYPTADDLLWLFAEHEDELRKRFLMYQPRREALLALLDKKRLHQACARAQVDTVESWFPESEAAAQALAPTLPYPMLLKPRTPAMLDSGDKGALARTPAELIEQYRTWLQRNRYPAGLERALGGSEPILQRYLESAVDSIYSLAGFVDEAGELLGARASVKVLQRPRRIGIGLCFESTEVAPQAAEAIARLCRETGYFGVFEAEFIVDDGRYRLIDFNSRFYGQMGFEHARGLPLAHFALLGAQGDRAGLQALAAQSRAADTSDHYIYSHRFYFEFLLALRRVAGSLSAGERKRWHDWYATHREHAIDASATWADWRPGLAHAVTELWSAARAPAWFLSKLRE